MEFEIESGGGRRGCVLTHATDSLFFKELKMNNENSRDCCAEILKDIASALGVPNTVHHCLQRIDELDKDKRAYHKLQARFDMVHMLAYQPLYKIVWRRFWQFITTPSRTKKRVTGV